MPPLSEDTAPWAEELLVQHWRSMTPRDKAALLTALCGSLHRLTFTGLRERHPELDDEALHFEAACLRLGRELAERVRADRPRHPRAGHEAPEVEPLPDPIAVAVQVSAAMTAVGVPHLVGGSVASTLHGEPRRRPPWAG